MPRTPNVSAQTRAVLAAFAVHPEAWRYGYDLSRETGIKPGTLYPMLMRLSEHRLLDSEWRPSLTPGRPPRHAYRLTEDGAAFALAAPAAPQPALRRAAIKAKGAGS